MSLEARAVIWGTPCSLDVRVPGIMCAGNLKDKICDTHAHRVSQGNDFFGVFFCWAFMLYNESSRHVRKFGLVLCCALEARRKVMPCKVLAQKIREKKVPFFKWKHLVIKFFLEISLEIS